MRIYGKMVFLLDLIPREQLSEYYDKCWRLARERNDREEIYRTSARYYQCTGDNERAAAYVDSVLTYYAQTGKKADLGSIYMAQSHMYEAAGNTCSSPAASSCCFWPVGASIWASWSGG